MMRFFRPVLATFLLASALPALAASSSADGPHVHVQLLVPAQALTAGGKADAGFYFKLEQGWHIYWKNAGDAGEPPHVKWTLPDGITAGALQFPAPKRLPLGPLMDFGYEDEVLFPLALNVAKSARSGAAPIHAKVDWLVCRSSCIPGRAELEVSRDVASGPGKGVSAADAEIFRRLATRLPKALPASYKAAFQPAGPGFRLMVETGKRETEGVFFPAEQMVLDNPAPQKLTPTAKGLVLELKKDANLSSNPNELKGIIELSGGRAFELTAKAGTVPVAGGATPNVAAAATPAAASPAAASPAGAQTAAPPAAPEATSALTQAASPATGSAGNAPLGGNAAPTGQKAPASLLKTTGLAFLGGLILNLMPCVFPVLFIKGLALVRSGNEERHAMRMHGLVYAAGILVSFWALVAVLLALRAAGATLGWGFQFQSPVFLALMTGLLFFLGLSLAGQFEIGLTLTSAGGSLAAKQGYSGSFFTGVLAVVVATPCTAPFMGAAIGYALTQSPVVTFGVFTALALGLAAPYVALTMQPAWTRWLPKPGAWMEVLRQAVSVPVFATVIWLAWVLARAYGASLLAALLASFLMLAIAGWFLGRWPARRWATGVAALVAAGAVTVCVLAPGKLVVASETAQATPGSEGWEQWTPEAVSRYQSQGRPVFVDFTASWCLSCQVNERAALQRPEVQQAFQAGNVALLKADWTRHDEAITKVLTSLGRSGVPAYALYAPGQTQPQLLPEVLTPGIVTDALGRLPRTTASAK